MSRIHIGGEEHDFIEITILAREFEDSDDFWDANWLDVECEIRAGVFYGNLKDRLRADEIADFTEHLQEVYLRLDGWAELQTLEGWLTIRFDFHGRGELWVDGDVIDNPVDGNRLRFRFNLDQSYVPSVISALRQTTKEFPVVGKPPNWLSVTYESTCRAFVSVLWTFARAVAIKKPAT